MSLAYLLNNNRRQLREMQLTCNKFLSLLLASQHWSLVCGTRSSAIAEWPRDASYQLKSCQLPRNSAETTCTTSPERIEVMKLKRYSKAMCNKHVHSTMTRSSRFRCHVGVINKTTTVELWISPAYGLLAVAKFDLSPQCRNCSRDPDYAPFRENFLSAGWDLLW